MAEPNATVMYYNSGIEQMLLHANTVLLFVQINCSYYSAVGDQDDWYVLARAIQFFTPGIPLVYYVGLLAGKNDLDLVEATKVGRDINRHGYDLEEAVSECDRPVVKVRAFYMLLACMLKRDLIILCFTVEPDVSRHELSLVLSSVAFLRPGSSLWLRFISFQTSHLRAGLHSSFHSSHTQQMQNILRVMFIPESKLAPHCNSMLSAPSLRICVSVTAYIA